MVRKIIIVSIQYTINKYFSGLRHPNLVLFMGAAIDQDFPVIVTEFMPRGSLFDVLQSFPGNMPYDLQIHIASGAASGIVR